MPAAPLSLLVWHLGRRGGGPRYTLELARSLQSCANVRVSLMLSRQSELFAETMALGLPTLAVDTYQSAAGFGLGLLRLPVIARQFRRFIEAQGSEIALCSMVHLWNPFLVGAIRRAGALNALVVHDAAPHPGDEKLIRSLMMRQDFRQADLLVSLTEAVARRLCQDQGVAAAKVIASRLGPFRYHNDTGASHRRLGGPPFRLLFFGRLLPYKGVPTLIAAMRILAAEGFPAQLRLVGQGPLRLDDLPLNVTLERRWVAEAEIPALFTAADLVILPYQEASQSGVLPIAAHFGVPALVTPVGGLLEQVEQGALGFVAPDFGPVGLADSLRRILSDPAGYQALSARLMQRPSDQSWAEIAASLVRDLQPWRGVRL